jgi:hypothetical protein
MRGDWTGDGMIQRKGGLTTGRSSQDSVRVHGALKIKNLTQRRQHLKRVSMRFTPEQLGTLRTRLQRAGIQQLSARQLGTLTVQELLQSGALSVEGFSFTKNTLHLDSMVLDLSQLRSPDTTLPSPARRGPSRARKQ